MGCIFGAPREAENEAENARSAKRGVWWADREIATKYHRYPDEAHVKYKLWQPELLRDLYPILPVSKIHTFCKFTT